ncbi:FadR/GntR family transcriptional regulator [Antiquaquibacter soli]|uniref:FadR/GntR family transcriptional regulator n=1 Tax=Antiquaquibacter soli TaxID=3064523 RepID=A0ABT9BQE0_9MICO|nr:FadR/GntR family transcriptional regulator [Protaetiibacter sp. WY-16]MDO7883248.1 FadR/GntR family transcriptional regulator [Protaetiibacter sp. WY-16]
MADFAADLDSGSGYSMRGLQGRVIEALGADIVGGRYLPGDLLPKEAELTEQYGVSRTSVREAMKVLAAKGLVEIRQKIGTRVRDPHLWSVFDSDILRWYAMQGRGDEIMRDLIELRQILEPAAARLAAGRSSMTDLRRIELAHLSMVQNAHDNNRYAQSDVEFHMAVYGASHNALLQRFGQLVADFMQLTFNVQQRVRAHDDADVDFTDDASSHGDVYNAINRGDAAAAATTMLDVVLDGKSALIEALAHLDRTAD